MTKPEYKYNQYNEIDWTNQDKTLINSLVNQYIIDEILSQKSGDSVKIFDMGFGIGLFFEMLNKHLPLKYKNILIEGCEPSEKNYKYFINMKSNLFKDVNIKTYYSTFLETVPDEKFDFISAIYVFPHISSEELNHTAYKINQLLEQDGKFILVVANEEYLQDRWNSDESTIIERKVFHYKGKDYHEVLHYSDLPEIGRLVDLNRGDDLYIQILADNDFQLESKEVLNDNGFLCSVYILKKL